MIASPVGSQLDVAVARSHRWLESMRGPRGYGGPVVHWWTNCLVFCDAGLDWRYEGIIAGYVTLFERTGELDWLEKARRAADDLLQGQFPNGHFRSSRFELNPGVAGTPHEAAADLGLLLAARALNEHGEQDWLRYLGAAALNLERFYLDRLWSPEQGRICDDVDRSSFVPNKAATCVEALCLLAELTGRDELLERFVRPTANAILELQAGSERGQLDGGIAQNTLGRSIVEKYFPYYVARCVPGLLAAYERLGDARYLESSLRAGAFVLRWRDDDGAFPQVIYPNGAVNRYPRWIAAVGDILRALELLRPYGLAVDLKPTQDWLLAGQLANGAFRPAEGFGSQASQRAPVSQPDARDLFPVVGWNDKAFRYLAGGVSAIARSVPVGPVEMDCSWSGQPARYREDESLVTVSAAGRSFYRWRKGDRWAVIGEANPTR